VKLRENVFNRRHHSFVASAFDKAGTPPEINPYFIMRFDCRQVNDVLSFWPN